MSKQFYLPNGEKEKMEWLDNFAAKLTNYATKYGIPATTLTQTGQDAAVYRFMIDLSNRVAESTKKITQLKNELANGAGTALVAPAALPATAPPFPLVAGIFKRTASVVKTIKASMLYLESDGLDMGIEGTPVALHRDGMKPIISVHLIDGGHPEIVWTKGQADALEIHVDRGTGFQFLNLDLKPNYTDTFALPADGTAQVWKYKAIYRLHDEHAGQWSDVVEISVK